MYKRWIYLLSIAFVFSSCATGLVAVHHDFPYICFLKGCRASAKKESSRGRVMAHSKTRGSKSKRKRSDNSSSTLVKADPKKKTVKLKPHDSSVSFR